MKTYRVTYVGQEFIDIIADSPKEAVKKLYTQGGYDVDVQSVRAMEDVNVIVECLDSNRKRTNYYNVVTQPKAKEYKYLVNVTFYAGSDDEEDTDRETYLIVSPNEYTEAQMEKLFDAANEALNYEPDYADEGEEAPLSISYYDGNNGLNIDTLMLGVAELGKVGIKEVKKTSNVPNISAVYNIVQWQ